MNLDRLHEFVTIVQEGSFRKAANLLGLAPSVLSARFQIFESDLNRQLLLRNSRRITLTSAGETLFRNGSELLLDYSRIQKNMVAADSDPIRSLTLQFCGDTMPIEVGPCLDVYCRSHPQLFINLYDENNCTIQEGLFSDKVDIAFAPGTKDDFDDFPGRITLSHFSHFYIQIPFDHPLVEKNEVSFADLAHETFILHPKMKDPLIRNLQINILNRANIPYNIYEDNSSPLTIKYLVPIGKGIRLWNWRSDPVPNTQLIKLNDKGFDTWMYLLYNPKNENPAIKDFIDTFLQFKEKRR
ncbi:DNA-binding transcriptional LysR family regulator [Lachnospiraceae bacterium PM6-15]|uniref:LysR family transcriptional regulator n=1 Tax=Ohessyouella blattaphilus TaxID=2949333 RepID=UPI003E1E8761